MPETEYRASRVCRTLGNPTAYQVIKSLFERKKAPSELASEIGVSVSTISDVLRNLRNIDVVRYEVRAKDRIYWIKRTEVVHILLALEKFVGTIRAQQW
ncbi:winged helix-turn-helix transcriptional regulator [candidate division WOR-3 bacterium]|nr:winged helix-turn-helix transcriptional regulator [candidate division WOR-3 bacterium]